jgi:glycosyltransferase involved in cell wall biosynthesis
VPALIALPIQRLTRARLLFDMRGFWADERVDGGLWPRESRLYRIAKRLEDRFLRAADHIVTLTESSARELQHFEAVRSQQTPISVIPTCADLDLFRPRPRGTGSGFVLGYIGSVGTWYLFKETLAFFRALLNRRPDARFLIVNRKEHDLIRSLAREAGVPLERIELVAARHDEVPALVRRMHVGTALIRPSYSKIASAPTKMAEYLACGVPCLGNSGVGDVAEILRGRNVGVVLDGWSAAEIDAAVGATLRLLEDPTLPARCESVARDLFSLEGGVATYRRIYGSLAAASA